MTNVAPHQALTLLDEINSIVPQGKEPSIIKEYNDWDEWYTKGRHGREEFLAKYAWAVPTKHAIEEIGRFVGGDTLLEVGAGSGLWAFLLQAFGVDVIPTDSKDHGTYKKTWEEFTPCANYLCTSRCAKIQTS